MSESSAADTRAVLESLFLLMRMTGLHGRQHPQTNHAALVLGRCVASAQPPVVLQFIAGAVFRDRALVPLDAERYLRSAAVGRALENLEVQEIALDPGPPLPSLLSLGEALARGQQGPVAGEMPEGGWDGARLRDIPHARWGNDAEQVDTEVFVAAQLALALADTEACARDAGTAWPWARGLSAIRRLERALAQDGPATARMLEAAPGAWGPERRSLAAALLALRVLESLGANQGTRRAAGHAALALGLTGYAAREGAPLERTAQLLVQRLVSAPGASHRSGVEPHRIRVAALVHPLGADEAKPRAHAVLGLLRLAYELEVLRCPAGVTFTLTAADLLAHAAQEAGRSLDAGWVRALVHALGVVPVGSRVQLPDGREGVVLGEGAEDDPWRPEVLVGQERLVPSGRVRLLSGRRRTAKEPA